MDGDQENIDGSDQPPHESALNETTQGLFLELNDESESQIETQANLYSDSHVDESDSDVASNAGDCGESPPKADKRAATEPLTEDDSMAPKTVKLEIDQKDVQKSPGAEEVDEEIFDNSDVEVLSPAPKEYSVVTLGDSTSEETLSPGVIFGQRSRIEIQSNARAEHVDKSSEIVLDDSKENVYKCSEIVLDNSKENVDKSNEIVLDDSKDNVDRSDEIVLDDSREIVDKSNEIMLDDTKENVDKSNEIVRLSNGDENRDKLSETVPLNQDKSEDEGSEISSRTQLAKDNKESNENTNEGDINAALSRNASYSPSVPNPNLSLPSCVKTSSRNSFDHPDISVSPIQAHANAIENLLDKERKTSTPGSGAAAIPDDRNPMEKNAVEVCDETVFKPPNNESYAIAIVRVDDLPVLGDKIVDFFKLANSSDNSSARENFFRLKKVFGQSKKNGSGILKRLSDISSLSGSSAGYMADGSSGASSHRHRYSILPDANIDHHAVISPLPKRIDANSRPKRLMSKTERDATSTTASQRNAKSAMESTPPKGEGKTGKGHVVGPDSRVFGKWVERTEVRFWPGVVTEAMNGGVRVKFDDGLERGLRRDEVIAVEDLEPGHEVNVERDDEDGVYNVVTLLAYPDSSLLLRDDTGHVLYTVQYQEVEGLPGVESRAISHKKVHLTLNQAKKIMGDIGGVYAEPKTRLSDVSLDNLLTGKRRSKQTVVTPQKRPTREKSNNSRRRKKGGANVETSVTEDETVSRPEKSSLTKSSKDLATSDDAAPMTLGRRKPKAKRGSDAKIFLNMSFVLTQGKRPPEPAENDDDDDVVTSSAIESETDIEMSDGGSAPSFDRQQLARLIVSHGGSVLDTFPDKVPSVDGGSLVVLSDRHCRTMTYLLSIVYNVARVNFVWIHNCVSAKELLPITNYYLPVGFSNVTNRQVERHAGEGQAKLFSGVHVLIASTDKPFAADWKRLLTRLGASVSVRTRGKLDRSLKSVDVVVGSDNPPSTIVKDAADKNMFVVSTEWIVQSLINGKKIPYGDYVM